MAQWSNTFNGSAGASYRLTLNVDLVSQSIAGNYSTVSVSAWVTKLSGTGYFSFSNSGGGNINVNGNVMGRSFGNYDFRSQTTYYFAQNEQYTIGHDAGGNANPYFGAYYDLQNSPGTSSTGGNWQLPTIPRYASITSFNQSVTDEALSFNWTSSDAVDYISWWSNAYDGGGHHDTPSGGTGPFSITLHNLKSNTGYDVTVAVRRADSGLWTQSGTATPVTLGQNNFMDLSGL